MALVRGEGALLCERRHWDQCLQVMSGLVEWIVGQVVMRVMREVMADGRRHRVALMTASSARTKT